MSDLELDAVRARFRHRLLDELDGVVEDVSLHGMAVVVPGGAHDQDLVTTGDRIDDLAITGVASTGRRDEGLSLTVHGGIRAGVTKSKAVAWIAADVDARPAKSKTSVPYRLTVVYEKTGTEWKVVQIHFS